MVQNTVVSVLETQLENSVQSLDLFCHGDPNGVYFMIGASLDKNIENKEKNPIASNIYISKFKAIYRGFDEKMNKMKNQYAISHLKLSAFTNESKVEIHGCNTGKGDDCFASELSKQLFDAGKTSSVVIGHASKANLILMVQHQSRNKIIGMALELLFITMVKPLKQSLALGVSLPVLLNLL